MGKLLKLLLLFVVGLGAVLVFRTLTFGEAPPPVAPVAKVALDEQAMAQHLASALRCRTISAPQLRDEAAFEALHRHLEQTYPRFHAAAKRELLGKTLLFTWAGSDPTLRPLVLLAHQDVVPVEPSTEASWRHGPFAGEVAEGFVWGRGAMDDKTALVGLLEAAELLLAEGFSPRRTVHLVFGDDEEIGGNGAKAAAELLLARGVKAELVLDEGMAITDGVVKGVGRRLAHVGIAEKGYSSVELLVEASGGHASMPPPQTAVGVLAAAVARLEANPPQASLEGPTGSFLGALGPHLPFAPRLAIANQWLLGPLLEWQLSKEPATNALLRTTTAATIFEGSVQDNVLPLRARAVVNFRIRPGESRDFVLAHVRRTVADERVQVRQKEGISSEPSFASPAGGPVFERLGRAIREVNPDVAVLPALVLGATDARHFQRLTDHVYRFAPLSVRPEDLSRAHGTDERVAVETLLGAVRFYRQLLLDFDTP